MPHDVDHAVAAVWFLTGLTGQASEPIPSFDLACLGAKSDKILRPLVWLQISTREILLSASQRLFAALAAEAVSLTLGGKLGLKDANKAHAAFEVREVGPFVLDC